MPTTTAEENDRIQIVPVLDSTPYTPDVEVCYEITETLLANSVTPTFLGVSISPTPTSLSGSTSQLFSADITGTATSSQLTYSWKVQGHTTQVTSALSSTGSQYTLQWTADPSLIGTQDIAVTLTAELASQSITKTDQIIVDLVQD
jgi:hypothetical protein